jgi:hypothetical protein
LETGRIVLQSKTSASKGVGNGVSIRVDNPLEVPDWDVRLLRQPQSCVFHSAAWARVLASTYGFKPLYLRAERNGQESMLPLMEVCSSLTGRRGISLPFTDSCEPCGMEGLADLVGEGFRLGRERKWKYLELRNCSGLPKIHKDAFPSVSFFLHTLSLSPYADRIFRTFENPVRRAIRRSEKSGLITEVSQSVEAVREFYRLHCRTRKKHGLPPQPLNFFLNIQRHILSEGRGIVVSAKFNERTVASAVFFDFGTSAVYKFGASDPSSQLLRPSNLVMWTAIQHYARTGIATLNLGRTSLTNHGLRRYKLGWGTQEQVIEYHKYDFRKEAFVSERDQTSGWYNNGFRFLPEFLARWAGALLYKHIA